MTEPLSPAPVDASVAPAPAADAAPVSETTSPAVSAEPTKAPDLFERIFGRRQSATSSASQTAAEPAAEDAPSTITLTQEELDRRVQAETDRREAKRQREAAEQARRDRQASIERKLTPGTPEYAPYEGAEEQAALKAEQEAAEQFTAFLGDIGKQHDSVTLDIITAALPKPELERIMSLDGAGVGLDGRKLIVSEGLKVLEKHWKAEGQRAAEERLRKDPVFRKRVFAEHRDQVDEPELLPANGSGQGNDSFIGQLLGDYDVLKGRPRRR